MGIGDSVYFFLAADFRISTHKNNLIELMDLTAIKNEQDFFKRRYMAVDDKFSIYSGHSFVSGKAQFENQDETYKLITDYVFGGPPCNALKRNISVDAQQWTQSNVANEGYLLQDSWFNDPNHSNLTAVLTIDWGDGSTIETISNYDGSIVNHTYALADVYEIQVSIDFPSAQTPNSLVIDPPMLTDGQGQGEYLSINSISSNSCGTGWRESMGETNNGTWKITAKIWTADWFLGKVRASYTHAWKKIGSTWRRRSAGIRTEIHSIRYGGCTFVSQDSAYKHNNNDRRVKKHIWFVGSADGFYNGDINSFHELYLYPPNGGVGSAFSMTLAIWHCN